MSEKYSTDKSWQLFSLNSRKSNLLSTFKFFTVVDLYTEVPKGIAAIPENKKSRYEVKSCSWMEGVEVNP